MKNKKLPFNPDSVLYQIYDQIPDPAGKNNFRLWFEWVTNNLINGTGSEKVILIDGVKPEIIVPYTGKPTTLLFTGQNGRPNTIVRIRWYDELAIDEIAKINVVMAQSLVDNNNNEFTINIEADTVDAREYSEPASYSDQNATQTENSIYLKRPTTTFYLVKRRHPSTNEVVVTLYGTNESEAVESDTHSGGGGGGGEPQ